MFDRRWTWLWLACTWTCLSGPAGAQAPRSGGPASPAAAFRDTWLAEAALDELPRAVKEGRLDELGKTVRAACLARLTADHLEDLKALNDMWYVVKACQYLPAAAARPKGEELVQRLVENREFSRLLFRALDDTPSPDIPMSRLQTLMDMDPKLIEQYANLAVAFATTRELRHYREQPDPASLEDSFKWYTQTKGVPLMYSLKDMPFEMSRYLADTRMNIQERQWAINTYRRLDPGKAYFDLKYDTEYYEQGKPKKIDPLPYTLEDLKKVGGVCIDQAYYSAEVCKAFGVPAAIVSGTGAAGGSHAWLAYLKIDRQANTATWDCQTGRYASQKYFVGEVRNPADQSQMQDCELMLSGAAALLPLQRREESYTATELADAVSREFEDVDPNRPALHRLAGIYNQRVRKASAPEIDADRALPIKRKCDASLTEDLLAIALERNLAQKKAWNLIVEMRKADRLPVDRLDRFFDVLIGRTAAAYPDYSCNLILTIVPTIQEPARRMTAYQKTLQVYGQRPDLRGRILIAIGDDFLQQNDKAKAYAAYEQAAVQGATVASVVVVAAELAEKMLLEAKRPDAAIALYQKLFQLAQSTRNDSSFRQDTAYYKLGQRLAGLLADNGKGGEAQALRNQLDQRR